MREFPVACCLLIFLTTQSLLQHTEIQPEGDDLFESYFHRFNTNEASDEITYEPIAVAPPLQHLGRPRVVSGVLGRADHITCAYRRGVR